MSLSIFDQALVVLLALVVFIVINTFLFDFNPKKMKKAYSILLPVLVPVSFFSVVILINLYAWQII